MRFFVMFVTAVCVLFLMNLNKIFPKIQMPEGLPGGGGMLKLRFDWYVTLPTELRGRTEKVGDDLGGESRRRKSKGTYECCVA